MISLKNGPDAVRLNEPSRQQERSRSLHTQQLPTNSALELFIQNGATIRSAIFVLVHSYSYMIGIPLVLHWVYGQ